MKDPFHQTTQLASGIKYACGCVENCEYEQYKADPMYFWWLSDFHAGECEVLASLSREYSIKEENEDAGIRANIANDSEIN